MSISTFDYVAIAVSLNMIASASARGAGGEGVQAPLVYGPVRSAHSAYHSQSALVWIDHPWLSPQQLAPDSTLRDKPKWISGPTLPQS